MNPRETAALDALIRRLRDEDGITILLIEHDMRLVMGLAERDAAGTDSLSSFRRAAATRFRLSIIPLPDLPGEKPARTPCPKRRSSALSCLRRRRCSAREVNIPVRLVDILRNEIVDEDPDVRLVPPENERRLSGERERRVHAGDYSLRRRLLVTRCPVYLSGEIEPRRPLRLERRLHLVRREEIVLDRISMANDPRLLQPGIVRIISSWTSRGRLVESPFT